jgi:uncharacterized protein (DUF169 family)
VTTIAEFNNYGELLERLLNLKTAPVAVKMLESDADIPSGAVRPRKDRGYHLAQCQAFAMARREKLTVAMVKEDNWCPGPVLAYGLVPMPEGRKNNTGDAFPYGKYVGILTSPLKTAGFEPDVVIMYSDTDQLRSLLLAMKEEERPNITGHFFPFSCASSVVTPMLKGQCTVSLTDPGEHSRALTMAGEMMFSIPKNKLGALIKDLSLYKSTGDGYAHDISLLMRPDFPQPELYKKIFEGWGMEHEK